MMTDKQLELTVDELAAIGFTRHKALADKNEPDRVYYTIPVLNGEFVYNVGNYPYKWYFRNRNGEGSNNNWLDINHIAQVYTLLQAFKAKFNLVIF
jgi:hypothetical protein